MQRTESFMSTNIFPAIDDELISGGIAIMGNKIIALGKRERISFYIKMIPYNS